VGYIGRRILVGVCICLVMAVLRPYLAHAADLPVCPDVPATYTGTDDTVLQLNALRREQQQACTVDRAAADQAHADAAQLHTDAQAAETNDAAGRTVTIANPPDTSTSTVTLSDDDRTWLHGDAGTLLQTLWVLAGCCVGLIVVPYLLRLIRP
jgi:hypothetical protein